MGLSYDDDKSLVETAASWRFASNPIPEIGGVENGDEERRDHIGTQGDDIRIQVVDR